LPIVESGFEEDSLQELIVNNCCANYLTCPRSSTLVYISASVPCQSVPPDEGDGLRQGQGATGGHQVPFCRYSLHPPKGCPPPHILIDLLPPHILIDHLPPHSGVNKARINCLLIYM